MRLYIVLLLFAFVPQDSNAKEESIESLFQQINSHPEMVSASKLEAEADFGVSIARSHYLPSIDLEVTDSAGFPGSSSLTGVGGLMGSPYRSGLGYGLVAQETLFDFGRTSSALSLAKAKATAEKESSKITAINLKSHLVEVYSNCALFKSLSQTWKNLEQESAFIGTEVKQFIRTGQRSVVERYLVDSQTEEAKTEAAVFASRSKNAEKILSEMMGLENVECKNLAVRIRKPASLLDSPFLSRARVEVETAQAKLEQEKANYLPRVVVVGSIGNDERVRLVSKQDYAIAGAIIFPLFDGFKTSSEVHQAAAVIEQKESDLKAVERRMSELDLGFEDRIESAQIRLEHLETESMVAKEGLDSAKKRYTAFEGKLVDVREALRNVFRVETQRTEAKAELFKATYQKYLIDGNI